MTNPYEPRIVGTDMGNATTTMFAEGRTIFFPSFVATMGIEPYQGIKVRGGDYHHITYNGQCAVVGEAAMGHHGVDTLLAETSATEAYKRYTGDKTFMAFLAGVSALYPDATTLGVSLATGAPLSIYDVWGRKIAQRYIGRHEYEYNGMPRQLIVDTASVFGECREAIRLLPEDERLGSIAFHDIGGKTWNVMKFENGVPGGKKTYDLGIERLFDMMPSLVSNNPIARWEIQCEMRKDPKSHPEVRAELAKRIVEALDVIETKVRLQNATRHALLGGGALAAETVMRARYRSAKVIVLNGKKPEGVNAYSYALAAEHARVAR
jgi:Actin like proteins N terminal domain